MLTLVIDAHPNPDSLCATLAATYAQAHGDARLIAVRDLDFNPDMRYGYTRDMELEPDLVDARAAIRAAEHIVVITPVWWRSIPALLKGFLDRTLLRGEDYRYKPNGFPEGLLAGRTGRVIATSDTPGILSWFMPDTRLRSLRAGTLAFCGIKQKGFTFLAPVRKSTPDQRAEWIDQVAALAHQDATAQ
ncbi:MAG: NAD(P)H-dependent oxidoreductase [Corynebacterium sp.]|uniref:NAD(P)H-dependent oxidoreductase n=1 Tax=Corynebacterium sp. TaxID=1720 RepID=UPI0026E110CC|nr:NAD(P)H-dependent oxidoreductase [Corynebacterium sp.]MDO5668952.1 NAD(P)H-dependent oxidoreductase [Corynebacterium sp.]